MADDVRDSFDVHVDHQIEFFARNFPKRGILVDEGRVVEQKIGRPMALEKSLGPGAHRVIVRNVDDIKIMGFGMRAPQFLNRALGSPTAKDGMPKRDELFGHR